MQDVTININNFDYIEFMNAYDFHGNDCHVTKAKDRDDNDGILLFIPTNNPDKLIESLGD